MRTNEFNAGGNPVIGKGGGGVKNSSSHLTLDVDRRREGKTQLLTFPTLLSWVEGALGLKSHFLYFWFPARDEQRGKEAINKLNGEGLSPLFHQLDLLSIESIEKCKTFLQEQYGGLDILVNNAGIAYKVGFVLASIFFLQTMVENAKTACIFLFSFLFLPDEFNSPIYRASWSYCAHKFPRNSWCVSCTVSSLEATCKVTCHLNDY